METLFKKNVIINNELHSKDLNEYYERKNNQSNVRDFQKICHQRFL